MIDTQQRPTVQHREGYSILCPNPLIYIYISESLTVHLKLTWHYKSTILQLKSKKIFTILSSSNHVEQVELSLNLCGNAKQYGHFEKHFGSYKCVCMLLSCVRLFLNPWMTAPPRLFCPWGFSGKNIGLGCHFLLQGIFQTQGSNLAGSINFSTDRRILYQRATREVKRHLTFMQNPICKCLQGVYS